MRRIFELPVRLATIEVLAMASIAFCIVELTVPARAAPIATGGSIELTSANNICPPAGQCASATSLLPSAVYGSFNNFGTIETLVASAEANANALKAMMDYGISGSSGNLRVFHGDTFTLLGPDTGPVSFTASLHITGTHNDATTVGAGFANAGHTFLGGGSSVFFGLNSGGTVDTTVTLPITLGAGDEFDLFTGITILGTFLGGVHGTADFGSTVTLSFDDLPDGFAVASVEGFNGVGSASTDTAIPEPMALGLFGLGILGFGLVRRRRHG